MDDIPVEVDAAFFLPCWRGATTRAFGSATAIGACPRCEVLLPACAHARFRSMGAFSFRCCRVLEVPEYASFRSMGCRRCPPKLRGYDHAYLYSCCASVAASS